MMPDLRYTYATNSEAKKKGHPSDNVPWTFDCD